MTRLLLIFLFVVFAACSSDNEVAGISTVETENAMLIQVVDSDSMPAANVLAHMRPVHYVRDVSTLPGEVGAGGGEASAEFLAEFTTDSLGRILLNYATIDSLKEDSVTIEILDGKYGAFGVVLLGSAKCDDDAKCADSVMFKLSKLGTLKGHVSESAMNKAGDSVWIQIYGTDRLVAVDSNGDFELDGLAPFEYEIRIVAGDSILNTTGAVTAGESTHMGVVLQKSVTISADSLVSSWMSASQKARNAGETTIGFIRLDSLNFDFADAQEGGADINVLSADGAPIPFAVSFWNDSLQTAQVQLQLDAGVESVKLVWGDGKTIAKNSGRVERDELWKNVDATLAQELKMVNVIDFESGLTPGMKSPAYVRDAYLAYIGDSSVVSTPLPENSIDGVEEDTTEHAGHVFHWKSVAPKPGGTWTSFVIDLCNPQKPCNLEAIDSVTFDIRGEGFYSFAFETNGWDELDGKTIYLDTLETMDWLHRSITPSDLEPRDDEYGNIGWEVIRHKVTHINISAFYTAEFWIDNIKIYGANLDDMK